MRAASHAARPFTHRGRGGPNCAPSPRRVIHSEPENLITKEPGNMPDTRKKKKLRSQGTDKRQCPKCHINADCAARNDCTEDGCPDFKIWKKEKGALA